MIIGVTGNSGTGKSEISKKLAKKLNADIIDADKIVAKLSEIGSNYYNRILELFGNSYKTKNGLNKPKIAETIYNNYEKRMQLNELTKKYVVTEITNEVKKKINDNKNAIIDAPLLFESGLDKACDYTIAILSDKENKIERICKRDNISIETAEARLNIQPEDEYYKTRADFIIINNSKIESIDLEEICIKIGKN